ncbi:MAG: DUF393 domain-containing protein [Polyangiaceae bacterium]|nr:DUF393 domain-containing protein [Polyangiaceae bacterium]
MPQVVEVFYDGECPLCSREIRFLKGRDVAGAVKFTDITAPGFDPATVGLTSAELMAEIRGRLPDGTLISGVEVFRQLYAATGFPRLSALSRWAPLSAILNFAYRAFARNRLKLTGRCDTTCSVSTSPQHPAH